MAVFSVDLEGLNTLFADTQEMLGELQTQIEKQQQNIVIAQKAVSDAERALASAENAPIPSKPTEPKGPYGSEEAAKEAAAAYASAMSSYSAAMSARESAISSARSSLSAAQQALTDAQAVLKDLQADYALLEGIGSAIKETKRQIEENNEIVKAYLTDELMNLKAFSYVNKELSGNGAYYGNKMIDSLAKVMGSKNLDFNETLQGFDYITDNKGNRYYVDLYDDMELQDWHNMYKSGALDAATLAQLMQTQGIPISTVATVLGTAGHDMGDDSWADAYNSTEILASRSDRLEPLNVRGRVSVVADGILYRGKNYLEQFSYKQKDTETGFGANGGSACKATALAMVASINTGELILPTDDRVHTNSLGHLTDYDMKFSEDTELNAVRDSNYVSADTQIGIIQEALKRGESLSVQVTTNSGSQHWVVVTNVAEGVSIDDLANLDNPIQYLEGFDPWGSPDVGLQNLSATNSHLGYGSAHGYMTVSKV